MQEILKLIGKFWLGKADQKEKVFLYDWVQKNKIAWMIFLFSDFGDLSGQHEKLLNQSKSTEILKEIHGRIGLSEMDFTTNPNLPAPFLLRSLIPEVRWFKTWMAVAAAVFLVTGSWWFVSLQKVENTNTPQIALKIAEDTLVENHTKGIIPIALADGSSVLLHPSSKLRYTKQFQGNKRNVFLSGKAFFEVARNETKPFTVISGEMQTRVLGTSFTVNAFENERSYSVTVKTGRVSVSTIDSQNKGNATVKPSVSIELTKNQQAVLNREDLSFARNEIKPLETIRFVPAVDNSYQFKNVGVIEILAVLSNAYDIPILADKQVLANCALTTSLNNKTLFEKMRIICESIGPSTTFKKHHDHIEIISPGCNL